MNADSKQKMRLGLAQCCHPKDGDVLAMAETWMANAAKRAVDILVFPEAFMTPFESSAADFAASAQPLDGPFCTAMNALAAKYGLWVVYTANECSPLSADETPKQPFNTAVVVDSAGVMCASYRKVHLFDTFFVKESDKMSAGSSPMPIVETPYGTIAIAICYDLRFPELARKAALQGAQVLIYASAWVDGPTKVEQWRTLLAARAIENQLYVAGLSRPDREVGRSKRSYIGNSCVFDPAGQTLASATVAEQLVVADIDMDHLVKVRSAMPCLDHRRPEVY